MSHFVELSIVYHVLRVEGSPDLVEHIYSSSYCMIKSFYKNHQIIIWLMTKQIELNVSIFIIFFISSQYKYIMVIFSLKSIRLQ